MNILHVVPSFGLGGMEKIICCFINNTAGFYGHEILVLDSCTLAKKWIEKGAVQIVDLIRPPGRTSFWQALYGALKKARPDMLMTYNWGATDAIWLGKIAGIRRIIHVEHGFNVDEGVVTNWKRDAARLLLYRLASKVIVVSEELETLMHRRYLLSNGRVTRIPNGIDTLRYSPDTLERERIRKTLGFQENDVVVGYSGRLDPIKNFHLLLRIFARCARQYPYLRLLIVGDGPEKNRLEAFCEQENLGARVLLAGQQEDVVPYLRAMDLFLLTSMREQMPMSILEAMSIGLPVIATKVGDVPNIIDHGVNGFVVNGDAPVATFVELVRGLLCPALRSSVGHAGCEKITSQFQEQLMVNRYNAVIQKLSR